MDALKVRHKMISHFAAIYPLVDINALVMDLSVKGCLSAINISGYMYVYCYLNEAAFMEMSIFLCK